MKQIYVINVQFNTTCFQFNAEGKERNNDLLTSRIHTRNSNKTK
jgi:hypothetical protein